jgi:hypothetical protein
MKETAMHALRIIESMFDSIGSSLSDPEMQELIDECRDFLDSLENTLDQEDDED